MSTSPKKPMLYKNPQFVSPLGPSIPTTQVQTVKIERPTLFQTVKDGFGYGTGISLSKWFFGSTSENPPVNTSSEKKQKNSELYKNSPCSDLENEFHKCLHEFKNVEKCSSKYSDELNKCLQMTSSN